MTSTLPELGARVGEGGKYRVVRKLGEGGMGAVYEAEQALTGKRVALKWMQPQGAGGGELAARFLQEAKAAARVHHPNVVDVYDFGRDGEAAYLVMEYLDGETLGAALARGTLSIGRVIALLLPVLRATASAHKQGIVHRDIKPDNIFLAMHEGVIEPKLLDFGISKLEPRDGSQSSLTRTGTTMGTPRYMSFEQLAGEKDLDGRADVYAFGVILYEALTGRPPFEAETFSALVVKMATTVPEPVAVLRSDIPPKLADAVRWAMERDRAQRCPSIEALIAALEPFAEGAPGLPGFGSDARIGAGAPSLAEVARPGASAVGQSTPSAAAVGPRTERGESGRGRPALWLTALVLAAGAGAGGLWLAGRGANPPPAATTPADQVAGAAAHPAEPAPVAPPVASAPPSRAAGAPHGEAARAPQAEAEIAPQAQGEVAPHPGAAAVPQGEEPPGSAADDPRPGAATQSDTEDPPRGHHGRQGRPEARHAHGGDIPSAHQAPLPAAAVRPTVAQAADPRAADPSPPASDDEADDGYYVTPDGRKVMRAPKPGAPRAKPSTPLVTSGGRTVFPAP